MIAPPIISPSDLSLPPKFSQWRPGQYQRIMDMADAPQRFIESAASTGSGKSVDAIALSQIMGERTVIVTSTKALQKQYTDDFGDCGLTDIRGRVNYECASYSNCAEGRLLGCSANKDGDCPYANDLETFLSSDLGTTNYSYLLSSRIHSDGIGPIGLLVLDECHNAVQELCAALEIHLDHKKYAPFYQGTIPHPPLGRALPWWQEWAKSGLPSIAAAVTRFKSGDKKLLSTADSLHRDLKRIASLPNDWILDESFSKETVFAPLWPTDRAQDLLFEKAGKILMMSATFVQKTADLLNVPQDDSLLVSAAYPFEKWRSPIYLFGADKIDHKTTEAQYMQLLGRMDTIISKRLDRKGIIHSVSYDRQQWIMRNSEYAGIMMAPKGHELAAAIEEFRWCPSPRILVSPAITTGYDFPGANAEYQFIIKVPFVDQRGPIMKARCEDDDEYGMYLTAQNLVQMCGRLMRGPSDSSETFILDKHIGWLIAKPQAGRKSYRHLFPKWFLDLIVWPNGQPTPPMKLQ